MFSLTVAVFSTSSESSFSFSSPSSGSGGGHIPGNIGTYGGSTTTAKGGYDNLSNRSNDIGSSNPSGMYFLHG